MKKKNNEGFSLVELIIVIAIMAVLIVVLAPQFIKFVEKGRESTDLQNITEAKTAVETYVADKGIKSSETFTVEIADGTEGKVIQVTGSTDKTILAEYGIADIENVAPVESEEWDADIKWTYTKYMWEPTTTASAAYLDSNGDEVE